MVAKGHRQQKPPADHPFLAFVNTVDDDGKSRNQNLFSSGAELVALLAEAGMDVPKSPPGEAQLRSVLAFREAAYAVLSARAARRAPPREESLDLETALKSALADSSFDFATTGLRLSTGPLGGLQDHLALQLFDLTTSEDFTRLSECRRCTRLFIDRGRGRGRRWCDMARCGNRAKAESFRARKRALKPA